MVADTVITNVATFDPLFLIYVHVIIIVIYNFVDMGILLFKQSIKCGLCKYAIAPSICFCLSLWLCLFSVFPRDCGFLYLALQSFVLYYVVFVFLNSLLFVMC